MTAKITSNFKSTQVTNFVNAFNEGVDSDDFKSLYVALAKDTPWDTDASGRIESDSGFSVPVVDENDLDTYWNESLVLIRLYPSNILPVVSECTYESGDEWLYNGENLPQGVWESSFASTPDYKTVMRNSEGRVYQCIAEPSSGTCYVGGNVSAHTSRSACEANPGAVWVPTKCTLEPTGLPISKGDPIVSDGYTWEYLWTLDSNTIIDKVNYKWQPVSYDIYTDGGTCYIDGIADSEYTTEDVCSLQPLSNWVYNSTSFFEQNVYGVDPDLSVNKVMSSYVMVEITLTNDLIGTDIESFRRLFLVDTPYTVGDEKASANVLQPEDVSEDVSGNIFLIENKAPVIRSPDQRESIKLILKF
jgi:hypothetical protein